MKITCIVKLPELSPHVHTNDAESVADNFELENLILLEKLE